MGFAKSALQVGAEFHRAHRTAIGQRLPDIQRQLRKKTNAEENEEAETYSLWNGVDLVSWNRFQLHFEVSRLHFVFTCYVGRKWLLTKASFFSPKSPVVLR